MFFQIVMKKMFIKIILKKKNKFILIINIRKYSEINDSEK